MPTLDEWPVLVGFAVVLIPLALLAVLGLTSLVGRPLSEVATARLVQFAMLGGFLASAAVFGLMLAADTRHVVVDLGNWVELEHHPPHPGVAGEVSHFHFVVKFVFDRLSIPFVVLTFVLCGTIGAFATKYMHRERGYNRFFVLYALFAMGMVTTALAGTIETLFAGWEMVGLSSALLVAFFQERPAPARNGLRVWVVYRISDAALLLAAVALHHMTGQGDFDQLTGYKDVPGIETSSWPFGTAAVSPTQALVIGLLLLVAAAGKSALVPFSGWLPRAMEGPTPSSAVFYGALSVHLGAYLLLRAGPLIDASIWLAIAVVTIGLLTAVFASLSGGVQTDVKSALSYASLAQVGIIVAEIGLGFRYVALVHLLGHACLRTLQFVRAPSFLQDYRNLENAVGSRLDRPAGLWGGRIPERFRPVLYRLALERGYFDGLLADYVATPFKKAFTLFDQFERRWTSWLNGRPHLPAGSAPPPSIDELP